jgi:hypothetical protein
VAVLAESVPLENIDAGDTSRSCRYFKMQKIDGHDSSQVEEIVAENIDKSSVIFSDKSKSAQMQLRYNLDTIHTKYKCIRSALDYSFVF